MNTAVAHHYRLIRARNPHYTAVRAYASAKAHLNFMVRLGDMVRDGKRRSRAARKGWNRRRTA